MGYRIQALVAGKLPYTYNGREYYPKFSMEVYFGDSGIGCFSRCLASVATGLFSGWVEHPDSTKMTTRLVPVSLPNGGLNPEYNTMRAWLDKKYLMMSGPSFEEMRERGFHALAKELGKLSNMFLIGDSLVARGGVTNEYTGTRGFVNFLIKNKIGAVVELPAILNSNYKGNPHLCQAWTWIPPDGCRGATVPAVTIHNEEALIPIYDAVAGNAIPEYSDEKHLLPSRTDKNFLDRLVVSKKKMVKKKGN